MALQSEGARAAADSAAREAGNVRRSAQVFLLIGVALMIAFFVGWLFGWSPPDPDMLLALGVCFWGYGALKLESVALIERTSELEQAVAALRDDLTVKVDSALDRLREEWMVRQWRERDQSPQQTT